MERVQFQQEQMLLELKDLADKNIFTESETKQIMKKRTAFETTLVRRIAKKADFLRYINYEMNLEQLRRKRITRLDLPPAPHSVSDYALVRRQFHIFERALKRFKSDVSLWIQYIQLAKREGARALVGRITARALQLHPNKPALYIIAASHELDHLSPSAARTLLQRGIRMNPESIDMWREYVRMELGFIESLRRRWDVLGISMTNAERTKGKKMEKGKGRANEETDPSEYISQGELGDLELNEGMEIDTEGGGSVEGDEGEAARRQIMQGAIVKSVMTSAAEALPQIGLFVQLKTVIGEYPSPAELRTLLLEHLYGLVRSMLPGNAEATRLLADRHILPELRGVELVDAIQRANEELLVEVKSHGREEIFRVYADFVEDWCQRTNDEHMRKYLISSLKSVIQQTQTSASLFSAHLRVLTALGKTDTDVPAKVVRLGQKYTAKAEASAQVWLARLDAEKEFGESGPGGKKGQGSVVETWRLARQSVVGPEEEVMGVWLWGLGDEEAKFVVGDKKTMHEELLKESMRDGRLRGVHEKLLIGYVTVLHEALGQEETSDQASRWMDEVRRIGISYLTSGKVWQQVFKVVSEAGWEEGKTEVLTAVYTAWRAEDSEGAGVTWAEWLGREQGLRVC